MGDPVVRFEIGCKDRAAATAFYEKVFGWTTREAEFNTEVEAAARKGVPGAITALGHEPHNYVMIYMEVADADASCERIRAHGGEIAIGPLDIPGGKGRFAWFKDPEGNMLGVFQPPV